MFQVQLYAVDNTTNRLVPMKVDSSGNLLTNNNKGFKVESLSVVSQNVVPTLAFAPDSQNSILLLAGGVPQTAGTDYTVSGTTVTWISGTTLTVGTTVDVAYLYTIS